MSDAWKAATLLRPVDDLKVALPKSRDALVSSRRIEHCQVKIERLPFAQNGMICQIVIRQWMDECTQAGRPNLRKDGLERTLEEVDLY